MAKPGYWQDKLILVTGGSSGIGLAAARQLAAGGAHVWLTARRQKNLAAALEELEAQRVSSRQKFGFTSADLSDPAQARHIIFELTRQAGVPDVLINSAGITHPGYVHELSLEKFEQLMQVNYFGTVYMTKAVLPAMMQRGSGQIINISSMAGYVGVFGYSAYGASKYAVTGFSEVIRAELKPCGIRVSVVFPPDTDTPQLTYEEPFKPPETRAISGNARALSAETVARSMLRQAEKGRFRIYPGFDSRLFHLAISKLPSALVFAILDLLADSATRKKTTRSGDPAHPDRKNK